MAKLFFVTYGGGHVAMLLPVIRAAIQNQHSVTVLALTTAKDVLLKAGIDSIGFSDLWGFSEFDSKKYINELLASHIVGGSVSQSESEAYLSISFADLVSDNGLDSARRLYKQFGRHAFLPTHFMQRVLKHFNPDLVIATNSPRAEQASIIAAGILNISSVCIVDLFATQEVKWIGQPGYADRLCVLNDSVRQMFIEHGRKPGEVIVTGNPAFDPLSDVGTIEAGKQLRRDRGWDDGRKIVLWASQVEVEQHPFASRSGDPFLPRLVESKLRSIVATNASLRLVIRYHPSERVIFEPAPYVDFSPVSEPISVLLNAVDVVVVTASTVGLEAAIAGRPVISVDTSIFTPDTRFDELGVSHGITDLELLDQALNRALTGQCPRFSQGTTGLKATQAVLRVIESLLV